MSTALRIFQDQFVRAIYHFDHTTMDCCEPLRSFIGQPAFAVYRNTIIKACIDALQANYPTVERLVGTDWFRAAAAVHVRQSPPHDSRLLEYGRDFAHFLGEFEPAQSLPYLANIAYLDRLWTEAHMATDDRLLNATTIAQLPTECMQTSKLTPQKAARWIWFADQPVYTIWSANREHVDVPTPLDWIGEGALITRVDGAVSWRALSAGGCTFLDACADDLLLDLAIEKSIAVEPSLDVGAMLSSLVSAGVFTARGHDHFLS
ncbi:MULTISPECIES: HvfC/BufC N-terminal domain-containing protein [Burkholderiaceae]|nr:MULTISPECIES: DNA-binding domain-containing protein [Burkholderiaceae]AME28495.1 hypothetical protein AXG89_32610 [Burkholderia sp. PAMC 26561]